MKRSCSWRRQLGVAATVTLVALLAASQRFGDSAHAMGVLSDGGGRARHPVKLPQDRGRYTLVVTATALSEPRGELCASFVGHPPMAAAFAAPEPVLDLGLHRRPDFTGSCFRGVRAGDRLTLWMVITPGPRTAVGRYAVRFADADIGREMLSIPVLFGLPGEVAHGR